MRPILNLHTACLWRCASTIPLKIIGLESLWSLLEFELPHYPIALFGPEPPSCCIRASELDRSITYFIGQHLPYFCQYHGGPDVFSQQVGPWLWHMRAFWKAYDLPNHVRPSQACREVSNLRREAVFDGACISSRVDACTHWKRPNNVGSKSN